MFYDNYGVTFFKEDLLLGYTHKQVNGRTIFIRTSSVGANLEKNN